MVGICRLCASLRKMDALTAITEASHEVCRKLRECFNVEIVMEDALPKNVCTDCVQSVQATFAFYSKVQEAQESLATLFPTAKKSADQPSPTPLTLAESLAQAAHSSVQLVKDQKRIHIELVKKSDVTALKQAERKRKMPPQECRTPKVSKVELRKVEVPLPNTASKPDEDGAYLLDIYETLDTNTEATEAVEEQQEYETVGVLVEEHEDGEEDLLLIEEYANIAASNDNDMLKTRKPEANSDAHAENADEVHAVEYVLEQEDAYGMSDVELQEELQQQDKDNRKNTQESLEMEAQGNEQELEYLQSIEEVKQKPVAVELEEVAEEEYASEEEEHLLEDLVENCRKPVIIYAELQHEVWSDYPWRCFLCPYIGNSILQLFEHAQEEHPGVVSCIDDMQFTCSDCQKNCSRYHLFLNHVRTHHQPALALCCDACDARYEDFDALDDHRRSSECVTEGNDAYPKVQLCGECGKAYATFTAVQVHARAQHTEMTKSYECETCGKCFKRLSNLAAHQRVHSDDKAHVCDLCGRKFKHKINLDVHYFTHVNERPFECTSCKKKFKTSINLEKHALVHTDIKQWDCSFCEQKFRTKDSKNSHERTHTGALPYECRYCGKRFRYRSTLNSHTYTHESVKPYSCKDCDHHFNNWSNYNKHMKRRHSAAAIEKAAEKLANKKSKATTKGTVSYTYNAQSENDEVSVDNENDLVPTDGVYILEKHYASEVEETLS